MATRVHALNEWFQGTLKSAADLVSAILYSIARVVSKLAPAREVWETIQLTIFLWNCFIIPLRLSFWEEEVVEQAEGCTVKDGFLKNSAILPYFIIDLVFDVALVFDMIFRYAAYAYTHNPRLTSVVMPTRLGNGRLKRLEQKEPQYTEMEYKTVMLWDKFLKFTDLLAAVPFAVIAYFAFCVTNPLPWRLVKLAKGFRVPQQFRIVNTVLERRKIIVNAGIHRMIFLWTMFTMFAHWMACGFFVIGHAEVMHGKPSWLDEENGDGLLFYNSTSERADVVPGVNWVHQYVRSIYWAIITMVTVGLGDITPATGSTMETLFALVTMYLGMLLTCCVIGNLTNMVANLDAVEDEFHNKIDNLNKYMAYRNLSSDLRDRIRAYYTYVWTSLKGVNEAEFLLELPITLRLKITGLRARELIKQVPFLRKAREPIINAICVSLEQVIVSPGDYVVRADTSMLGCYWLRRGEAEIVTKNDKVLQNISGKMMSFFGENSLFFGGVYDNHIRCKSYCEFFFLKRDVFDEIINEACTEDERANLKAEAEKAGKRNAKVKKFFGLGNEDTGVIGWKRHFEPKSRFREIWNIVQLVGVILNSLIIPYRLATQTLLSDEDTPVTLTEFIGEWFFDLLFIIDVVLRAKYFGFVREGIVVRDKSNIFKNYRKHGNWVTDLIILMPWDFGVIFIEASLPILRAPKILRLAFFLSHYDTIQGYLAARRITMINAMHRIIKIFIGVIIFVHFVGCGWMWMAKLTNYLAKLSPSEMKGTHICSTTGMDWVCMDNATWPMIDHSQDGITYLRAIYFVLVDMTTVGYGDIIPYNTRETAYVALITLFGGLGYPAVVGAMAALISNLDTARAEFKQKLSALTHYMSSKEFPRPLRVRIHRYYDYLWSRQRGVDEDFILNDLPSPLRMEVQEYINGSIMRNIDFFEGIQGELFRHILSVLKPAVFLPNDKIIEVGELGREMYLLERGATRVTSADGNMTYAVLSMGDYFGEGSLLGAVKRTANVVAIGYCDCFVLTKDDFDSVTRGFPDQKRIIISKLQDTLTGKKQKNGLVMANMQQHEKLALITNYEYKLRKAAPENSWRHPDSLKRKLWDVMVLGITMYNLFAIPFRIAISSSVNSYYVDYCLDLFMVVDVYRRMNKFGYIDQGHVYTKKEDIKENYAKRRYFIVDRITTLPTDLFAIMVYFMAGPEHPEHLAFAMALFRLPKLFLFLRLNRLVNNLDNIFENSAIKSYALSYDLFKLIAAVVCISHWTACIFYGIANFSHGANDWVKCMNESATNFVYSGDDSCPLQSLFGATPDRSCGASDQVQCLWEGTWIHYQIQTGLLPNDGGTIFHQYIRALNWAIPTLVVVVIGDNIPVNMSGTLYVTIGIVLGVTINAAIIGNIANLVANLEGTLARYREKMDTFEHFLYTFSIPTALQQRTRNYLEYVAEVDEGNHSRFVDEMPMTLRVEVSNFLKLKLVKATPFFGLCDVAVQKNLAALLKPQVYSPDDFLIYEGDIGHEMFFIESGHVQMVQFKENWRVDHRGSLENIVNLYQPESSGKFKRLPSSKLDSSLKFSLPGSRNSQNGSVSSVGSKHSSGFQIQGVKTRGSTRKSGFRKSSISAASSSMRVSLMDNEKKKETAVVVLATIEAGGYFGETAVFFDERRMCSVQAVEFTEVFILNKEELNGVLGRYPLEAEKMFDTLHEIRENNIMRNKNVRENLDLSESNGFKLNKIVRKSLTKTGSMVFSALNHGRRGSSATGSAVFPSINAGELEEEHTFGSKTLSKSKSTRDSINQSFKSMSRLVLPKSENKIQKSFDDPSFSIVKKDHVFLQTSLFFRSWSMFSLLFTCYLALSVPFKFVFFLEGRFPLDGETLSIGMICWYVIEIGIDIFFLVDIVLRYSYFTCSNHGQPIKDKVKIAANYRRTWMACDLLASAPFEICSLFIRPEGHFDVTVYSILRLNRLFRLARAPYYLRLLDRYLHEIFPRLNSAVVQVMKMFLLMLLLNHWYACTWFGIHRFVERNLHNTWAVVDGMATYSETVHKHNVYNDDIGPWFCYLRSLYFTVTTMSSVGYGDIRPYTLLETIHELLVVITGACIFAALIGCVAVVYLHADSRGEIAFKGKLRKLIDYMEFRELPKELQREIVTCFTNHWDSFEGLDFHKMIADLPLPLQLELSINVHRKIIRKVRGLRKCHVHVQRHIARKLFPQVCEEGEYLYRKGDIGNEIYFVLEGNVLVTTKTDDKLEARTLGPGSHFGGETLYSVNGERLDSAKCITSCTVYYLHKDSFEDIVYEFPEHRDVGIFDELLRKNTKTTRQTREMKKSVETLAGKGETPLQRFSSRHISSLMANTFEDSSFETKKDPAFQTGPGLFKRSSTVSNLATISTLKPFKPELEVAGEDGSSSGLVVDLNNGLGDQLPAGLQTMSKTSNGIEGEKRRKSNVSFVQMPAHTGSPRKPQRKSKRRSSATYEDIEDKLHGMRVKSGDVNVRKTVKKSHEV